MNRTLLKTCTYGVMHFTVAVIVAYALTRDWTTALAVGMVEPLVQTVAFAAHERFWARHPEARIAAGCAHAAGRVERPARQTGRALAMSAVTIPRAAAAGSRS